MADDGQAPNADGTPTGDATGSQPTATGNGGTEPTYTKAQVEALVEDRLRRDREKRERDTAKATETAEADRLKEQQKYAELAEQRQTRISELEPQAQQAERYEAALKKHLDAARKDLPGHITELLDQLDVAAQLEWISAHQAELAKPVNGTTGVPGTPRAATPQTSTEREAHYQQRIVSTGAYDHL
jgi:hypothetical protein